MPKLTPPPRHPCKHCGAQTPDPRRKYCDPCWQLQRLKRCRPVVAVKPVPKPPRRAPVRPTVCGHCGGHWLSTDYEGDVFCVHCGWVAPPGEVLPLVRERQGQRPGIRGGLA